MQTQTALSAENFAQIVDRFGARPENGPEGCWRFPLRHCRAVARTQLGDVGDEGFDIEIADLSMCGLGFRTAVPLNIGISLVVMLNLPGLPPQTWCCRVVDVHSFDGRTYCLGASFERPSPGGNDPTSS